ncbi:hypothetical protein RUM43_005103 [Polyplax serrata]|uniref:Uncharacterized protein n=1 Tax=Polyplax serrata TaxID=468196 RepID=A0AAN8SBM0_POLSC
MNLESWVPVSQYQCQMIREYFHLVTNWISTGGKKRLLTLRLLPNPQQVQETWKVAFLPVPLALNDDGKSINVAVQCLSTDFSSQKGVKIDSGISRLREKRSDVADSKPPTRT